MTHKKNHSVLSACSTGSRALVVEVIVTMLGKGE